MEQPGRKHEMGIGEANEPEKGEGVTNTRKCNDGGPQEKAGVPRCTCLYASFLGAN